MLPTYDCPYCRAKFLWLHTTKKFTSIQYRCGTWVLNGVRQTKGPQCKDKKKQR